MYVCLFSGQAYLDDNGERHNGISLPEDIGWLGRLSLRRLLLLLALWQLLHVVRACLG